MPAVFCLRHDVHNDGASLPGDSAAAKDIEWEAHIPRRLADEADAVNPDVAVRRRERTLRALADADADRLIDDAAMQGWADAGSLDRRGAVRPGSLA